MENHFGIISIEWKSDPKIKMETWEISNNQKFEYTINLSELQFDN